MPQYLVATPAIEEAPAHTPPEAKQPRHAVVTYIIDNCEI